jgi:opacity protein-like surface antigen
MKKITFSLVSFMALSGFALAGGDISPVEEPVIELPVPDNSAFYLGLGYGYFDQTIDAIAYPNARDIELEANSLMLQAGYRYNQYVAAEGRYWIGFGDISQSGGQTPGDHSGDFDAWGLYIKPMYPVAEKFDIYGLLGYADTSIEYDDGAYWDTDGFSWGFGAQYAATENILIFADYLNLGMPDSFDYTDPNGIVIPDIDADINLYTFNIGVSYKF